MDFSLQKKEIAEKVGIYTVTKALKMPEVQELVRELLDRVEDKTVTNLADAFDQAAEGAFNKL